MGSGPPQPAPPGGLHSVAGAGRRAELSLSLLGLPDLLGGVGALPIGQRRPG